MNIPWLNAMKAERKEMLGMNNGGDPNRDAKNVNKKKITGIMDELMLAFCAANSLAGSNMYTGGIENLVCENRKPDPIGGMQKNLVAADIGITLAAEPVQGADRTDELKFVLERGPPFGEKLGATAACTARLAEGYKNMLLGGDAWFMGLKPPVRQRNEEDQSTMGPIKTNKKGVHMDKIRACVIGKSRGAHCVFTATIDGVEVMIIGYLFSHSALPIVFITSCGTSAPGELYHPKFQDEHGNISEADVPRPDCITQYFKINTLIDDRNHMRQHSLKIERRFPTTCPYTKIVTGMIGEVCVDMFLMTKWLKIFDFDKKFPDSLSFVDWLCAVYFLEDRDTSADLANQQIVVNKATGARHTLQAMGYKADGRKQKQVTCAACTARRRKASASNTEESPSKSKRRRQPCCAARPAPASAVRV